MKEKSAARIQTVLLADDNAAIRSALEDLFSGEEDLCLVGICADADEALLLAAEKKPDVLVIDMHMPKGGGIRVAREARAFLPTARIIAFTAFDDAGARRLMEDAGVDECIVKGSGISLLLEAIRAGVR